MVTNIARPFFKWIINLGLVVLFSIMAFESCMQFAVTRTPKSLGLLTINTLFLSLYLWRRPAKSETNSIIDWLLGTLGTALPLLLRATPHGDTVAIGAAMQLVGMTLVGLSIMSIGRSFAVIAADRGIQYGGLYMLIRHPMYISELIFFFGFIVANPNSRNLAIFLCECFIQFARANREEQILKSDPEYREYCKKVPFRFIHGFF